jgi:hypothetical protein
MKNVFRRRPSAPMVVAMTALVLAVSGSAVAASSLVKGDRLIEKHSLSGNRLRNHTITATQVNTNKLSTPISKVTYAANTVTVPRTAASGQLTTVSCPTGTFVIGGGASVSNERAGLVNDSYPQGKTLWAADIINNSLNPMTATVTAICAPAGATAP